MVRRSPGGIDVYAQDATRRGTKQRRIRCPHAREFTRAHQGDLGKYGHDFYLTFASSSSSPYPGIGSLKSLSSLCSKAHSRATSKLLLFVMSAARRAA